MGTNRKPISPWMGRTQVLLGEQKLEKLVNSHVLVVGLGGVGGIAAEMIARTGVGKMTIVDADTVDPTNRNRQIPALHSTEGKIKAEVLAERLLDINPDLELTVIPEYLKDTRTDEILNGTKFDYALDCIDTLAPKVFLLKLVWIETFHW
jgi:tRNA A37 threonylcarbamoyladenosine dehydratase